MLSLMQSLIHKQPRTFPNFLEYSFFAEMGRSFFLFQFSTLTESNIPLEEFESECTDGIGIQIHFSPRKNFPYTKANVRYVGKDC